MLQKIDDLVWGIPMIVLILSVGILREIMRGAKGETFSLGASIAFAISPKI